MARKTLRPPTRTRTAARPSTTTPRKQIPRRRSPEEEYLENILLGVLLFFIAVLVFYPAFSASFIWDDDQLLTSNPQIASANGWWSLFIHPLTADYFPLMSFTLWVEYHLGLIFNFWNIDFIRRYYTQDVWSGYHVTNILFHATASVLTWQTLKRLKVPGALIAAVLFAIHPVCVESVAWIAERKNTLSQIFFLMAIIHYVRFEERGKLWRYVIALICFLLALLAKTSVVMLPVILLMLAWWRHDELEPMRESYEIKDNPIEEWCLLIGLPVGGALMGGLVGFLGWGIVGAKAGMTGAAMQWVAGGVGAVGCGAVAAVIAMRWVDGLLGTSDGEKALVVMGGTGLWGAGGAIAGRFAWFLLGTLPGLGALAGLWAVGWVVALITGALAGYYGYREMSKGWAFKFNSLAGIELARMIPFFDVAALLGAVTIFFQYWRAISDEQIPIGSIWERMASACFATGFYIYSALWPFDLMEIYPQWHRAFTILIEQPKPHIEGPDMQSIPYYIQVLPGLAIGGLLYYCWRRRGEGWARAILIGLGTYIVAMLPALGLLKMSYMRLTLVADHFQYIAVAALMALIVAAGNQRKLRWMWLVAAGLFFTAAAWVNWETTDDTRIYEYVWVAGALVLAWATFFTETWKIAWWGFLLAVVGCFFCASWTQAGIYKDEMTLWSTTVHKNPKSWQAHNHLGAALYTAGRIKEAAPHFKAATVLKPENPESHNNLGLVYSMAGDMKDAIEQYETATRIKDDSAMDTNLANAYEGVGRYDDAIRTYEHALQLSETNASAHCNLGYALMKTGHLDEAIGHFMRTIEIEPSMGPGRSDLAKALEMHGIDPNSPIQTGTYPFDLQKALQLLRAGPPPGSEGP
jgi:tetratricopeptide (TPR) repeat protein